MVPSGNRCRTVRLIIKPQFRLLVSMSAPLGVGRNSPAAVDPPVAPDADCPSVEGLQAHAGPRPLSTYLPEPRAL